jgi:hypothetical protein
MKASGTRFLDAQNVEEKAGMEGNHHRYVFNPR